jgi:hypothetical protein
MLLYNLVLYSKQYVLVCSKCIIRIVLLYIADALFDIGQYSERLLTCV